MTSSKLEDRLLLAIAISNAMQSAEELTDAISHMAENTAADETDTDAARAELEHLEVAWTEAERSVTALRGIIQSLAGGGTSVRYSRPITGVVPRIDRHVDQRQEKTSGPKD